MVNKSKIWKKIKKVDPENHLGLNWPIKAEEGQAALDAYFSKMDPLNPPEPEVKVKLEEEEDEETSSEDSGGPEEDPPVPECFGTAKDDADCEKCKVVDGCNEQLNSAQTCTEDGCGYIAHSDEEMQQHIEEKHSPKEDEPRRRSRRAWRRFRKMDGQ